MIYNLIEAMFQMFFKHWHRQRMKLRFAYFKYEINKVTKILYPERF